MIECNQYATFTYILLSNGKVDSKGSYNHQKHTIYKFSLGKLVNRMETKFIRTSPSSRYGGFAVFGDGCLYNMPEIFLSTKDIKASRQNKIIPINEENQHIRITTACYTRKGTKIIIGCKDGSLHVFNVEDNM